jgi:hypothetical protein
MTALGGYCERRKRRERAFTGERDETAIEQLIDRWSEQQAVLAVEALGATAVAPRFAVARA